MRRCRLPVGFKVPYIEPVIPPDEDDVSTWPNTAVINTMQLPGDGSSSYFLLFDITSQLHEDAIADTDSLRFVSAAGTKLGHVRTATNRILLGGVFLGGSPITVHVYWGKASQSQPGDGFPSSEDVMANFIAFVIIENDAAIDYAPDPATFTEVGTPTYEDGYLGQQVRFGNNIHLATDAAKLTTGGRLKRNMLMLTELPDPVLDSRCVMWGNWTTNQRSLQLWTRADGVELYIDDNGTSPFQTWTARQAPVGGLNFIGGSWRANDDNAIVLLNNYVHQGGRDNTANPIPGQLYDASPLPFILGGTGVNNFFHPGAIEAYFELVEDMTADQMRAFFWAWRENAMFFMVDRTPLSLDVLDVTGVSVSSEVEFPQVRVSWVSPDTPISVGGDGNPTYAIGSAQGIVDDIRAKASTPSVVKDGDYVTTYHESSNLNSTQTVSTLTVGTVTSERRSTTVAATSGPTPPIPEGEADVVVDNVPALLSAIAAATGGQIIEIVAGDYKAYGKVIIQNKNNAGNEPIVVRASTRPWDGFLGNGLVIPGETTWQAGSGGAEFGRLLFNNLHNIVFDGFRGYAEGYTLDTGGNMVADNSYAWEGWELRDVTFRYCSFCGNKPPTPESAWGPTLPPATLEDDTGWRRVPRGFGLGNSVHWNRRCERVKIQHCVFRYLNFPLYIPKMYDSLVENCFFSENAVDHIRNDGDNENTVIRYNIFGRVFPQYSNLQGSDVWHPDCIQNTSNGQNCLLRNTIAYNIMSVSDSNHGKMQGFFIEQDGYPTTLEPIGNTIEHNLLFATSANTIYLRPSNANVVRNNTIIADFHSGQAPDSYLGIILNAKGLSFGNNTVSRNIHDGTVDVKTGDISTQNMHLQRNTYGEHLVNYSSTGTICRLFDPYSATLDLDGLARLAPRATSAFHPNNAGYPIGCSELFRHYGVLP